jgi:hypothetical protein
LLPLDERAAVASIDRLRHTTRLIQLRDTFPESRITLIALLTRINDGYYTATADVAGLPAGFSFPPAITTTNEIRVRYDEPGKLTLEGLLTPQQREALLTDASLGPVTGNVSYQDAIKALVESLHQAFASDVEALTDTWSAAEVTAAMEVLSPTYPSDYLQMETWDRLQTVFNFVRSLNAGVKMLATLAAPTMGEEQVAALKQLLRSKFGVETWLTLCAEIQDVLRERKRDALAAYLLTRNRPADAPSDKWENTNDLYAYYLLDVEMGACQLTSRLVQASGSVQLLVQRCFMGLEPRVVIDEDPAKGGSAWRWWRWMRKYRVWEANRKIFLWPENWIEPELRRDRSEIFRELENELLQNEVDQSTAEGAVLGYLAKLNAIARLEVVGLYQEDRGYDTLIHVFARTPGGEPRQYYYRRFRHRMSYLGEWTPWEHVDLDIQGEYLVPAVLGGRLFLFWPVFTEVQDETANSTMRLPATGATTFTPDKPKKRLRMQMAASEYRQGMWTPKTVSTTATETDPKNPYTGEIDTTSFMFFPIDRTEVNGSFAIKYQGKAFDASTVREARHSDKPVRTPSVGDTGLYGEIELSGCRGVQDMVFRQADVSWWPGYAAHIARVETDSVGPHAEGLRWIERNVRYDSFTAGSPQDDLTVDNLLATRAVPPLSYSTPLLARTPGNFAVTPAWHGSYVDRLSYSPEPSREWVGSGLPFFYSDKNRAYFVLTVAARKAWDGSIYRMYYPELKAELLALEHMFGGEVDKWVDSFIASLTPPERDELSGWLAFHDGSAQPPFSDAQLKGLVRKFPTFALRRFLKGRGDDSLADSRFHFKNFYHPLACEFGGLANDPLAGIGALYRRETQMVESSFRFYDTYGPKAAVVEPTGDPQNAHSPFFPRENVDFDRDAAYGSYNWELFFHVPLLIANSLSRNQRFDEARDWYHFIFNPLGVAGARPGGSTMSKFWITKPFFETTDPQYLEERIDSLMRLLAGDVTAPGFAHGGSGILESVFDWREHPFEPHRIASYRTVAYQKTVVIRYVENLVAWGDHLFRQDSMESINEATQLYVMAAEILGPRPKTIPSLRKPPVETFNELEHEFDQFSNAIVRVENLVPLTPPTGPIATNQPALPMLYFCIPQNEQLLKLWDTVADRLYKVRHCMNIEGVVRQVPLFEPPIDPAALVKAVAGGADIGAALADLNAPLPLYRFTVLLQKATEVCNDVKALGAALLAALEKKDAEALGLIRQSQEIRLNDAVRGVREQQIDEARENLRGLEKNKELVTQRRDYYQDIERVNAGELLHQSKLKQAHAMQQVAQIIGTAASVAHIVPSFDVGGAGAGGSPRAGVSFGGPNVGSSLQATASVFNFIADVHTFDANQASIDAGYDRRWEDWKFQERLANKELEQIESSIAAARLRIAIAEKELANQTLQLDHAKATDAFLRSKYTNGELYQWQLGQISGVYFQTYRLAYDLATRAERCARFELGWQDSSYVTFGHWDSLKKGLMAGEKLQYDLRRLETAVLDQNRREFELTKHVSLALLDPLALVRLRETGRCFFRLPEEIFDRDFPGHYFRRIKSVSVSVPAVLNANTTVSCTLRLLRNSIRINTANGEHGYRRNEDTQGLPADDARFIENNIPVKATAVSSALNDSGTFELNFRDDRYLPFEGAGVVSEWSLELFNDPNHEDFGGPLRQYDYETLSDIRLHVRYTAREDAGAFKAGAIAHLRDYYRQDGAPRSARIINLRQAFPTEWARFLHPDGNADNVLEFRMRPELFPGTSRSPAFVITTIWLLARCADAGGYRVTIVPPFPAPPPPPAANPHEMTLMPVNMYGGLHFAQKDVSAFDLEVSRSAAPATWRITMVRPDGGKLQTSGATNTAEVEDLLLIVGYRWKS